MITWLLGYLVTSHFQSRKEKEKILRYFYSVVWLLGSKAEKEENNAKVLCDLFNWLFGYLVTQLLGQLKKIVTWLLGYF